MQSESTRSLIIGAFALTGQDELTAAELIALARPCGVTPTNLKAHLTRMVADGSLQRRPSPRASTYRPSERRRGVMEGIRARLRLTEQRWDGEWLLLLAHPPADRSDRDRIRRRLQFDGFRHWNKDTFVRPAWPRSWAMERAAAHARVTAGIVWRGVLTEQSDLPRLAGLYDLERLHRSARRMAREVERGTAAISTPPEAWARLIALGGRAIRTISEDPLLPPELWGERTGVRELVAAHRTFERICGGLAKTFVRETLRASRGRSPAPRRAAERSACA